MFSTDSGGFSFSCQDIKVGVNRSSWAKHLSQLAIQKGMVRVITNQLPDLEYISGIIAKHPISFAIIANVSASGNAVVLKQKFPDIQIALHSKSNAKLVLVEPGTVWLCTNDFGKSSLLETSVGFHSSELHDHLRDTEFNRMWDEAEEL